MAITVVQLTTEAQFQQLHDLLVSYFDTDVQCSPRSFYPSLGQIRRADRVYVGITGGTPVVGALVENDGHINWLNGKKAGLAANCIPVFARIFTDCGSCWGLVKNAAVRAALMAASTSVTNPDSDDRLWWVP